MGKEQKAGTKKAEVVKILKVKKSDTKVKRVLLPRRDG